MSSSLIPLAPFTTLHVGDALAVLTTLPSTSVDAVITDPPYAIKRIPSSRFERPTVRQPNCASMGCSDERACNGCERHDLVARFDSATMLGQQSQNWHARETHSRGYADNDPAQFQAWCCLWLSECLRVLKPGGHLVAFGGTRTWHRLAVAAEDSGFEIRDSIAWLYSNGMPKSQNVERALLDAGHTVSSGEWSGWGTALRPAHEPIVLARRPLEGTMAGNITTWGIGPLNLAAMHQDGAAEDASPRWPANVHLDGPTASQLMPPNGQDPSRAFWVAKPGRAERIVVDGVAHPTVKPLALMRRLARMVTAPDGIVLDPFAGSGTTLEACVLEGRRSIGIERESEYIPLIRERLLRQSPPEPSAPSGGSPLRLF